MKTKTVDAVEYSGKEDLEMFRTLEKEVWCVINNWRFSGYPNLLLICDRKCEKSGGDSL